MIRLHSKHKINRIVLLTAVVTLFFGIFQPVLAESNNWRARTVEEVKEDLQFLDNGINAYVVKWGDTLYALSLATNISIDTLAKINHIENIGIIETGTTLYFNADKTIMTITDNLGEIKSFDVVIGENSLENILPSIENSIEDNINLHNSSETIDIQEDMIELIELADSSEPINNGVITPIVYTLKHFLFHGVINWSGYKFTYYSQSVLPGGGLKIPGRHVNENGYVVDGDGYIVLANNAPLGTIIDTPFGAKGKVYDRGTYGNHFDVYVK